MFADFSEGPNIWKLDENRKNIKPVIALFKCCKALIYWFDVGCCIHPACYKCVF